jgi:hypothetical protein
MATETSDLQLAVPAHTYATADQDEAFAGRGSTWR